MFDVVWDAPGEKIYETGLDRGVLYPPNKRAVPWNGLVSIDEDEEEAETEILYFDGVKRYNHVTPGHFSAEINALTYPDEFMQFDGFLEADGVAGVFLDNQYRKSFGLSYRTFVGNDELGLDYGYKIHLLYNLVAEPSSRGRETIEDSIEASTFSWNVQGIPITPTNRYPTAHIIIDVNKSYPETIEILENLLYGNTNGNVPGRLPTISELELLTLITVTDNNDGTGTITGPDSYVYPLETGVILNYTLRTENSARLLTEDGDVLITEDHTEDGIYRLDIFGLDFISETEVTVSSS